MNSYISDIGAQSLKPLFIVGCCITTIFLDLSFVAERWLRHRGALERNTSTAQRVLVVLSIICALVGTFGLILLSIFDTLRYPSIHRLFLLLFMLGYVLSAIFVCWEYQRLGVRYRQHRVLRLSFWIKLAFIIVEFALAIGFGYCLYREITSAGAILEWVISLIFTFYVGSFIVDLLPATRRKHRDCQHTDVDMGRQELAPPAMTYHGEGQSATSSDHRLTYNTHIPPDRHAANGSYNRTQPNGYSTSGSSQPFESRNV
ncbi:MAG: hypothetical protein M1817_001864 [Caeruleum heppii]|nr:MAG: hypothetical protein M1817_001864 [Caeruleum heppii]